MKSASVFLSLALAAGIGAVVSFGQTQSQDDRQSTPAERMNRLLVERRDVLRQMVEAATIRHGQGEMGIDELIRARNELLDAEVALAKTGKERIQLHEDRVENLRLLEDAMRALFENGGATPEMMFAAKAARLGAEIELLKQQMAGGKAD